MNKEISKKDPSLRANQVLWFLTLAVMGWYVFLAVIQYAFQRPMWNDEECVFHSIQAFSPHDIFHKILLSDQVFPRLYMFCIQSLSHNFDFSLLSLRFLPFVAMMGGFFTWLKIMKYELKNPLEYFTFVLSWTSSAMLIYYASELKQYSLDLFLSSLYILFFYNQRQILASRSRLYPFLLVIFPFSGLFSYPSMLFALILGYNLLRLSFEDKSNCKYLGIYAVAFVVAVGLSYQFDMRLRPVATVTKGFGDYFISLESVGQFFKTLGEGTTNLFCRFLVERPRVLKRIVTFFMTFGLVYMVVSFIKHFRKEKFYISSLNVLPFALYMGLFTLGALKKYPFVVPRTALFFAPIVLFLAIKGIRGLRVIHPWLSNAVYAAYLMFLVFVTVSLSRITFTGDLGFQPYLW
jgi:hypothetical protein